VVRNSTNVGYAAGVNTAWPHARGEFVAVLNADCRVEAGWLGPLVDFMRAHPEAAAVNPLLLLETEPRDSARTTVAGAETAGERDARSASLNARDSVRINAAGQDVHVTGLGFNRWLWRPWSTAGDQAQRVSGLQGGAFLIRRAVLQQMGGWDDSGFLYHEDVELSWMLHLMGYDLFCIPAARVWHDYHLTMYPEKLFLLERNRWAMLLTHLRAATRWRLAPLLLVTEILMWGFCLLRGPGFLRAKAASYRWVTARLGLLAGRRHHVESLRRRDDAAVLRRLRWNYAWDQLFSLGGERGPSRRQPAGGLPVSLGKK
jgi:GT2 family glycosyltransferase